MFGHYKCICVFMKVDVSGSSLDVHEQWVVVFVFVYLCSRIMWACLSMGLFC